LIVILCNFVKFSQGKTGFTVFLKLSDRSSFKKHIEEDVDLTLEDILNELLKGSSDESWQFVEMKSPLPRRRLDRSSTELRK
jgi:hypothetical protein